MKHDHHQQRNTALRYLDTSTRVQVPEVRGLQKSFEEAIQLYASGVQLIRVLLQWLLHVVPC